MIIHPCVQGTEEWRRLRLGRPTASEFHRIVTPTGKPSSQASDYCNDLLGELMLGRPLDGPTMPWMERGQLLEEEARRYYEFQQEAEVELVGFCTTDDLTIGCSPDGLVGEDGLVEIKCPAPGGVVEALLSSTKTIDKKYWPQVQGQLFVTGRRFVDLIAYHPELPAAIVRVERDEAFQKILAEQLKAFVMLLDARRWIIDAKGWIKKPVEASAEYDWLGITDKDIELMCAQSKGNK